MRQKPKVNFLEFIPRTEEVAVAGMPPVPASQTLPDWYKSVPNLARGSSELILRSGSNNATVKRCVPFLDAMTAGYTAVLANDVQVWWKDGVPIFEWGSPTREMITAHSPDQVPNVPVPEGYYHQPIKWSNDFIIKTPKNYSLFCMHPSNQFQLPFLTISGFVDTDSYETSVQFPFWLKEGWSGIIEAGTPVAQLIPIQREDWKSEVKPFDRVYAYRGLENLRRKIERSYKSQYWTKKRYL